MENSRLFMKSLARAFSTLEILCKSPTPFGLSELAKKSQLNISNIQRITYTLQKMGVIDRDPNTKEFRIGPRMIVLTHAVMENLELKKIAHPIMEVLSDEINEVVGLCALSGNESVLIDIIIKTNRVLNINLSPGDTLPMHTTASGKVILAFLPDNEIKTILKHLDFKAVTSNSITSSEELENQLEKVREKGYATTRDEGTYGLAAIAMPIRNNRGNVVAALAVMVPSFRADDDFHITSYREKLHKAASKISLLSGYRGTL